MDWREEKTNESSTVTAKIQLEDAFVIDASFSWFSARFYLATGFAFISYDLIAILFVRPRF